ncbi:MAG TPA: VC0807 family protein [Lacunisphaera sp.]|jgi:hypothetical protein
MNTTDKPASRWALWRPYVLDIGGPFIAYFLFKALGAQAMWAMTVAGLAAGLSTLVNTLRRKKLDALGVLVLLEIVVSLLLMIFVRDPRLMFIRPSFYTAMASVVMISSAFGNQPLTFVGSRQMAATGGPTRLAAFERTWDKSAEFRTTHRRLTLGFGIALAVDSILRIVIVYGTPVDRSAWLSNVPHLTAMVLMIGISALAGRKFSRLVDEQM